MKTASILDELYTPVLQSLKKVPSEILNILESTNPLIEEVVSHFFQTHGKMLRPAMTLLGAAVVRSDAVILESSALIKLAASFEIFHSATLIHDDIIDAADIRRGLTSVNTKWNSQIAVLAGDFLHDRALITIFENGSSEIMRLFLRTAGAVCDGEIHELRRVRFYELSEAEYFEIIYKKTSSLLACVLEAGARAAEASEDQAKALSEFGRHFGNAFQIIDDCLDFTANQEEFGKTLGTDLAAGVLTLPLIRLFIIRPDLKPSIQDSFAQGMTREKLQHLVALLTESGALAYALQKAQELSALALKSLQIFPQSSARQSLEKLAGYILERSR